MLTNPVTSRKNLVAPYHNSMSAILAYGRNDITAAANPMALRHSGLRKNVISVMALALMALAWQERPASARCMTLFVVNGDHKPVTITLTAGACYEGEHHNGQKWQNLAPGKIISMGLCRVQGNGCDGEAGNFSLTFDPDVNGNSKQDFWFDNAKNLHYAPNVNRYPGNMYKLPDGNYRYVTFATPKVTAGKAKGSWKRLCSGNCNLEISTTLTNQTTKETTVSEETRAAVAVSLEAGVEYGIASAKVSVTAELEETIGKTMSEGVLKAKATTNTTRIAFTTAEMRENKIHAVWQWVATTELSNGQLIVVESEITTCTPDGKAPNYLPDSKEDIGSCSGALANKPAVVAPPVVAPPVPVATTDFSGAFKNDGITLTSQNILGQPGTYGGTIVIDGQTCNFRAQAAGDTLRGAFDSVTGNHPFEARRNGAAMTFSMYGTNYQLVANNAFTNPNPPATPNAEISVVDTRAWTIYKRPTGLTLRCPADWKVLNGAAPNESSWVFTPPIVVEADRGNVEVYLLSSEPSRGIENVNDPRVFTDVEGNLLKALPFLRRAGAPHNISTTAGWGVVASWEGQNNNGLTVIANAHWIIHNNNLYLFLAMGDKNLITARGSVTKAIFASFAP